jgi:hypothetical protein
MNCLKETIIEKTTNQKFVLVEGLCNCEKLQDEDDKLELRFMDEFFSIEAILGEVKAIIGLQFNEEQEYIRENDLKYIDMTEFMPKEEEKPKVEGDENDDEPEEQPAEEEEDGPKKEKFEKEKFSWTISDRQSKNLPQLYQGQKGINALTDVKQAESFGSNRTEQVACAMNEFCHRLYEDDNSDKYLYRQIIFPQSQGQ